LAQKNRSKEVWLVPKRGSLHQAVCLIDGIIERKYDGTSWNSQKQNNLGVNLKNWGATQSGKNISSQSIRTLVAAVPQYLGFLYINTNTTPNSICLTDVGKLLHAQHKAELKKIPNLAEGDANLIKQSQIVLNQMEKLQLTNPIYLKDCENILVFPFRMTLKLLLKTDYLDREEVAYFLLRIKDESEFGLTLKEIQNFRKLDIAEREKIIQLYKETHIGNITLVQAASASYYESLCQTTGIIDKVNIRPINLNRKICAIKIKDEHKSYVEDIINNKYFDVAPYGFGNNLNLWIEYMGNPNRLYPPIEVNIENNSNKDLLIQLKKDGKILNVDLLGIDSEITYPMFIEEEYEIVLIDAHDGSEISIERFMPKNGIAGFKIKGKIIKSSEPKTIERIAEMILEHSNCNSFTGEMLNYLTILKKVIDIDKTNDKALRGAYYEYLFYLLLSRLKDIGKINDVIWNGKIGKYGLPLQAPGGRTGTADMTFIIDDVHYVLELTTIKSKSGQEKAELASVPDHIRLYKQDQGEEVIGIFCAPIIHERNVAVMNSIIEEHDINLHCISDIELVNLLLHGNKQQIIEVLK